MNGEKGLGDEGADRAMMGAMPHPRIFGLEPPLCVGCTAAADRHHLVAWQPWHRRENHAISPDTITPTIPPDQTTAAWPRPTAAVR